MKIIFAIVLLGFTVALSSCERCAYCRCYGENVKYCQKDYSKEDYKAIETGCATNPYCGWYAN